MSNQIDEYELTKGQKLAGNIISGVYTLVCGVFLLLVGLGIISPLTIENTALVAILITIGLVFFTTSLIQVNTVSLWLSFCFFTPRHGNDTCQRNAVNLRKPIPGVYSNPRRSLAFHYVYVESEKRPS